jgi:hypothetical protein
VKGGRSALGSLRRWDPSGFRRRVAPAFLHRPPAVSSRVQPPSSLPSPSEFDRPAVRPDPPPLRTLRSFTALVGAPPMGLPCPSSRHQQSESTHARRSPSSALRSVPGVSHALDGLLLRLSRGLVSSRNHVQGFALQGFGHAAEPCRVSPTAALPPLNRCDLRLPAPASPIPDLRALLPATSETPAADGEIVRVVSPLMGFLLLRVLRLHAVARMSPRFRPRPSPR